MVVIRLALGGAKKRPFYHVVAADRRNPRDGRHLENLGYFNPIACGQEPRLDLDMERISAWVAKGAQPSPRVKSLMREYGKAMQLRAASGDSA